MISLRCLTHRQLGLEAAVVGGFCVRVLFVPLLRFPSGPCLESKVDFSLGRCCCYSLSLKGNWW